MNVTEVNIAIKPIRPDKRPNSMSEMRLMIPIYGQIANAIIFVLTDNK
jgi:hypothetical protein